MKCNELKTILDNVESEIKAENAKKEAIAKKRQQKTEEYYELIKDVFLEECIRETLRSKSVICDVDFVLRVLVENIETEFTIKDLKDLKEASNDVELSTRLIIDFLKEFNEYQLHSKLKKYALSKGFKHLYEPENLTDYKPITTSTERCTIYATKESLLAAVCCEDKPKQDVGDNHSNHESTAIVERQNNAHNKSGMLFAWVVLCAIAVLLIFIICFKF